jgi:methyl-accepting chemotaxis protein
MQVAKGKVQQGASLARDSGQALDELLASAQGTQEQTDKLVAAHQAVASVMASLNDAIESVSAAVSQNIETAQVASTSIREALGSAEMVAMSTMRVSDQTDEVNQAAAVLTRFARELEGATAQFKIQ